MAYQENKNIGLDSRFLVKESPCKISALKLFPVAQNLGATLGLQDSLQVTLEVLTTKEKKLGLDFDLTKTCAKFHPKIFTLCVSNSGAKKRPKMPLLDMAGLVILFS
jgi:hypothetical protein